MYASSICLMIPLFWNVGIFWDSYPCSLVTSTPVTLHWGRFDSSKYGCCFHLHIQGCPRHPRYKPAKLGKYEGVQTTKCPPLLGLSFSFALEHVGTHQPCLFCPYNSLQGFVKLFCWFTVHVSADKISTRKFDHPRSTSYSSLLPVLSITHLTGAQ